MTFKCSAGLGLFMLLLFLSPTRGSAQEPPLPTRITDCKEYVDKAMSQVDMYCGPPTGRWEQAPSNHMNWCLAVTPEARASENAARSGELAEPGSCRRDAGRRPITAFYGGGHGSPPLPPVDCRVFAWRALSQQAIANWLNNHGRCPPDYFVCTKLTSGRWLSNFDALSGWCTAQHDVARIEIEDWDRRKELSLVRRCAPCPSPGCSFGGGC
jgi:hypothetical protein